MKQVAVRIAGYIVDSAEEGWRGWR